jgi:predicted DNA-binding transcriptional regulator AlpA
MLIGTAANLASTAHHAGPKIMPGRSPVLSIAAPMPGRRTMKTFEFSVVASGLDPNADDYETRFYEAGCDDALVAFQKGHTIVDFAREAPTLAAALTSAMAQVIQAGAVIDRIEPDPLVSLADIAHRTGMTRAAMTQYAKGQRGKNFPAPLVKVTSDSPLWDWAEVASWLAAKQKIGRDEVVQAKLVKAANRAIETGATDLVATLERRAQELESEAL